MGYDYFYFISVCLINKLPLFKWKFIGLMSKYNTDLFTIIALLTCCGSFQQPLPSSSNTKWLRMILTPYLFLRSLSSVLLIVLLLSLEHCDPDSVLSEESLVLFPPKVSSKSDSLDLPWDILDKPRSGHGVKVASKTGSVSLAGDMGCSR